MANTPARLFATVGYRAADGGADREPDPRAARTTGALGRALVALLEERAFDAITVQDILDRAGVGRTAFYAHYRNKHDVLFSSYEGMLAAFDGLVDRPSPFGAPGSRCSRSASSSPTWATRGGSCGRSRATGCWATCGRCSPARPRA
jgi:AcrR family transcriptional regulator